jgi:hypothetical protein
MIIATHICTLFYLSNLFYYGSIFYSNFIKYITEPYSILNYRFIYLPNLISITIMCIFILWIYFTIFLLILMHNLLLFLVIIFKITGDSIWYIFYFYNIFYFTIGISFSLGIIQFLNLLQIFYHYFSFYSIDSVVSKILLLLLSCLFQNWKGDIWRLSGLCLNNTFDYF